MQHIGFIMDGNRRWAKKLKNIASFGHEHGSETLERVLEYCLTQNIPYVSVWALSRENIIERSEFEIQTIYALIRHKIPSLINRFIADNIRLEIVWDIELLPIDIQDILHDAKVRTKNWSRITFILALGYSGQNEIIRGIKKMIEQGCDVESLDEKSFLPFLDTGSFPPPDLIVRTGWNIRHSGYFLYQSAYSEYFFTETLWPDFDRKDFDEAIAYYEGIQRNFWK
jgi:undecaprenyl diphosphate synthase